MASPPRPSRSARGSSREQLVEKVGGKAPVVRALISSLVQAGQITIQKAKRQEGNRYVARNLYALANEPRPDQGQPWTELAS